METRDNMILTALVDKLCEHLDRISDRLDEASEELTFIRKEQEKQTEQLTQLGAWAAENWHLNR